MLLVWLSLSVNAQSVTVGTSTGDLLAGLGQSNEIGFNYGWKSIWWHKQLPLKIITADHPNLDEQGILAIHANNLNADANGHLMVYCLNAEKPCKGYMVVTLPKGYRFTGYELTLLNNQPDGTVKGMSKSQDREWFFYETSKDYDITTPYCSTTLGSSRNDSEYTISRTSLTDDDMGNNLYFVLSGNSSNASSKISPVVIKKFTLYFSTEADFAVDATPLEDTSAGSFKKIRFNTGKIALGDIRQRTQQGSGTTPTATHYAYEYHEVEDIYANVMLYQTDAVEGGKIPEDASGDYQDVGSKHITEEVQDFGTANAKHYYGLKNDTYYIESPTTCTTTHGTVDPIGYRITKAEINYHRGTDQQALNETVVNHQNMFTISVDNVLINHAGSEYSTYYLHPSGRFVKAQSGDTDTKMWMRDNASGATHIYHEQNGEYTYLSRTTSKSYGGTSWSNEFTTVTTTEKLAASNTTTAPTFNVDDKGRIYFTYGRTTYYLNIYWDTTLQAYKMRASTNSSTDENSIASSSDRAAQLKSAEVTRQVSQPSFTASDYTLTVYDKDGSTIKQVVEVNSSNPSGTVVIDGMNNDAVKFSISGLPEEDAERYRALITAKIYMQALDPYISSLDIVCTDNPKEKQISQQFTAADFSVHGGRFTFYVPEEWENSEPSSMPCTFSFENLRNNNFDNTYYYDESGSNYNGTGRNCLVGSAYYPVPSTDETHAMDPDEFYVSAYEADNETDYKNKVSTHTVGKGKFRFNNTDDLDPNNESSDITRLQQYPFSIKLYREQLQTKGIIQEGEPAFRENPSLNANSDNGGVDAGEFFLTTCDEPRYNIAPTYNVEHRSYAFYEADIILMTKNYQPTIEWEKVYDTTLYNKEGRPAEEAFFGVKFGTTNKDEQGGNGYLPVDLMRETIEKAIEEELANPTGNVPTSKKQILYIDASNLYSVIFVRKPNVKDDALTQLKNSLADNAIIFLPKDLDYYENNFCYKDENDQFIASKNIIITDQKPFFSPYDIQVETTNEAIYTRIGNYDERQTLGTLILPFGLKLEDGVHKNVEDDFAFELYQMQSDNCLTISSEDAEEASNYFNKLENNRNRLIQTSEPNTPYMFNVTYASGTDNISFVARQGGATIAATPKASMNDDYTLLGETSTGNILGTQYQFTNLGTFAGKKLSKDVSALEGIEGYFYFGNNALRNIHGLRSNYAYVTPFRSFFPYGTSNGGSAHVFNAMSIVLGENFVTTDMELIDKGHVAKDLVIQTGKGFLKVTSFRDTLVTIHSLSGMQTTRLQLVAGQTESIQLPKGIYVVNNIKVLIK